ncbi:MAG: nucleotidyltransferase domain-containing protein [Opitutales bacterium]|nr:nucleotidyltransferase domain-containing protein [Opitutales bacterium]
MTTVAQETAPQRTQRAVIEAAARHLPHARLVLFGSRATGAAGRRSDFDLAVIPGPHFSPQELIRFREALEESPAIIHPIDVLDIRDASPELEQKIKEEGIVWKS